MAQELFRTYQTHALLFEFKYDVHNEVWISAFKYIKYLPYFDNLTALEAPSSYLCGRHVWSCPSILAIFPQEGAEGALPKGFAPIHSPHPNTFGNKGKGLSTHCAFLYPLSFLHPSLFPPFLIHGHSQIQLIPPIRRRPPLIWKNHQPNHRSLILLSCRI